MHKHSVILFPGGMMPPHWGRVPPVPWCIHARSAYGCPSLCSAHHRFALTRQKKICSVNFRPFSVGKERSEFWHQVPCLNKIPQFFEPTVFYHGGLGWRGRAFFVAEGWVAGQRVKRMEGFWETRNCFKFAALFVGAERTEVHGTYFCGLCLGTWHRHP